MYSFDGSFRRKPQQSFGGASKKEERSELLQRTQENRQKRENERRRISSAITIQAFYRSYKVRQQQCEIARQQFDALSQSIQKGQTSLDTETTLARVLRPLIFCYRQDIDADRLTWVCQQLVRNQSLVSRLVTTQNGLYQVQHLLAFSCNLLYKVAKSSQPVAVTMRMLEVYTSVKAYKQPATESEAYVILHKILRFLIDKGYYKCMRVLIEQKIPFSIEHTVTAPTPLAGSIMDLVYKPLIATRNTNDVNFTYAVLQSLCKELLCGPFCEQITQYVLPVLAHDKEPFPFTQLLLALLPVTSSTGKVQTMGLHDGDWSLSVEATPWLLCAVLTISEKYLEGLSKSDLHRYLMVLYRLVPQLQAPRNTMYGEDSDSDDDINMDVEEQSGCGSSLTEVRQECLRLLNQPKYVRGIISTVSRNPDPTTLTAICTVCHTLMAHNKLLIHKTRLLYSLAFDPTFLKHLWYACATVSTTTVTGSQVPLLQILSRGMQMSCFDLDRIVPLLSMFSCLFSHLLISLYDGEFYREEQKENGTSSMPFRLDELVLMTQALREVCLGIIELAHPETKPAIKEDYKLAFQSVGALKNVLSADQVTNTLDTWAYLFKVALQLLKSLYARDTRRQFCPNSHWLSTQVHIHADKPAQMFKSSNVFIKRPFGALSALRHKKMMDEDVPLLSTTEVRHLTVLTEIPFVVPFEERVKIFHKLVHLDRMEEQGEMRHLAGGPHINLMVRRNYLYEDAFEKLSPDNEPNLKLKMQVQLVNFAGLDEAGIDGGGIMREFMAELIKTSFDPNRGFFKMTNDRLLYPNPEAGMFVENYTKHYYFMGRILGKAIYENMLVELPFTSFFLTKILSRTRYADVDIHHLQSLDPLMYKNLLFMKTYEGDVSDLGLDFTVVNNELGEAQVEELKPGGREIPVTNSNRIEYIYLMADYRLNKQIRTHVNAFRQGLADLINLEWLRMFDYRELQTLISGAQVPIDIADLMRHTNYSGGYNDDHPLIKSFWKVVSNFTDRQKRQLLKFVTSCSRSPLLGFKDLYPAFCIHYAGNEEGRLPTASTCMNLLKLPEFKDEDTLKNKLLYAIESGTGFELS